MHTIGKTIGRIIGLSLWGIGLCALFGCAASAPAFPVTGDFRCEAQVNLQGQTYCGTLTRAAAGTLTFELNAPESVRGWTFRLDGETVTLTLQALSYTVDPAAMPAAAPVRVLVSALDTVARMEPGVTVTAADGAGRTAGSCSAGTFVLSSDPETGFLRALTVSEAGLDIRFSAFTVTAPCDPVRSN